MLPHETAPATDTILVTGGAGFIGSHFVRQWLQQESGRLINLDKLTYAGNLDSLGDSLRDPRHLFVRGDVADRQLVDQLLEHHRPWAVVHCAAETHVDRSIDGPWAFVEANVCGTFQLLEAVRRYWERLPQADQQRFRCLQVSTDEVFGSVEAPEKFNERSRYAPNSPYAASKAAADHFVRAYRHTYGLPVLITHCSNNYGPYQFPEKLIPLMTLSALGDRPLPIYGDGQQVRDWLYVEDHCHALRTVLRRGLAGETYNIGGDQQQTNLEVVQRIARLVNLHRFGTAEGPCDDLIRFVADRPGHDRRYAIDSAKMRSLGWTPALNFAMGLERTVQWYLAHQDWVDQVTSGNYRLERLGLEGSSDE